MQRLFKWTFLPHPTTYLFTCMVHTALRATHFTHRRNRGSGLCLLPDSDLGFAQRGEAPVGFGLSVSTVAIQSYMTEVSTPNNGNPGVKSSSAPHFKPDTHATARLSRSHQFIFVVQSHWMLRSRCQLTTWTVCITATSCSSLAEEQNKDNRSKLKCHLWWPAVGQKRPLGEQRDSGAGGQGSEAGGWINQRVASSSWWIYPLSASVS